MSIWIWVWCWSHWSPKLGLRGHVACEELSRPPNNISPTELFINVYLCACLQPYSVLQRTGISSDCCILIVSPHISIQVESCTRMNSACEPFQVVLTVPTRWPARREHTKVPVPPNMVLMTEWGALSWSLMVWLTVGMYGNSITESRQAIFTDTPVTVPARCLWKRKQRPISRTESKCFVSRNVNVIQPLKYWFNLVNKKHFFKDFFFN